MRRLRPFALALVVTLAVPAAAAVPPDEIPASRDFVFTYNLVLEPPADAQKIDAWIPVPTDIPGQDVRRVDVETTLPYRITTEETYGNRMVHIRVKGPGAGPIRVKLTTEVQRHEYRGADTGLPNPRFLKPNRLVPTDGIIAKLSSRAVSKAGAKTPIEKARAIYDFVTETVSYDKSGTGWGRGDALFACDTKQGNCTDFHALFVGMARSVGIPARFEIGFPLREGEETGTVRGYHCWAEFWVDGRGWIPVDSSEASKNSERREYYFGTLDPSRVEFTKGRDIVLNPPQQGEPLNYFVYPYIEFDGKPLEDKERVKVTFSFKDV